MIVAREYMETFPRGAQPDLGFHTLGKDVSLLELLAIVWAYKPFIFSVMAVFAGLTFTATSTLRPVYRAEGTLGVDTSQVTDPLLRDAAALTVPQVSEPTIMRNYIVLLTSADLAQRAVDRLNLMADPELNPTLPSEAPTSWPDTLRRLLRNARTMLVEYGLLKAPKALTDQELRLTVIDTFRQRLRVINDGKSYTIQVSYTSHDPNHAAEIVNAVMLEGIAAVASVRQSAGEHVNAWFTARLDILRTAVTEASERLRQFRAEIGQTNPSGGALPLQQLAELSTKLTESRAEATRLRARNANILAEMRTHDSRAHIDPALLSSIWAELRSREVALLQRTAELGISLGPDHPTLRAATKELERVRTELAAEQRKALRTLEAQAASADANVRSLETQVERLKVAAQDYTAKAASLSLLEEDVRGKQVVLQMFLNSSATAYGSVPLELGGIRVLAHAVEPRIPVNLPAALLAAAAAVIGGLLALIWAIIRSQTDRGFETGEQLETETCVPLIGAIPQLRSWRRRERLIDRVIAEPFGAVSETLRGIVASLRAIDRHSSSHVVMVTSSEPGEGKTSVVAAIARLSAHDGLRVIALDCDLRNSSFGQHIGHFDGPGIEDVLEGTVDWRDAIRVSNDSPMHTLCVARRPSNPGAMIGSRHWKHLIGELRKHYEIIIIDTPPVLHVADASVLSWQADVIMMVVRGHQTQKRTVKAALKRLMLPQGPATTLLLNGGQDGQSLAGYYLGYTVKGRLDASSNAATRALTARHASH
jgi:capsular exopolysaccharide synthesis family protein